MADCASLGVRGSPGHSDIGTLLSRKLASDVGATKGEIECGTTGYTIIAFVCVALYNVIELTFIIWGYFKQYSGLYFWSFNIATYGIAIYSLGFLFKALLPVGGTYVYVTMVAVGWVAMIMGQSFVLWSRLHLVLRDRFKLRLVLWVIIINSICMFVPTLTLLYGTNSSSPDRWRGLYSIYESIQVSMFFAQEGLLSVIYIWETIKLARLHSELRLGWRSRRLMIHLIVVNVVITLFDIAILGLEYANLYGIQTSYKAFVYSVKLKMEFTILNRLKEMITGKKDSSSNPSSVSDNRQAMTRCSTGAGTEMSGGIYPYTYSSQSYPRRPPPVSWHAHVQGMDAFRDSDRRDHEDGNSMDNDVVLTTEILVEREERTSPVGDERVSE